MLSNLFQVHQNDACLEVIVRIIHAQLIFEVGANCGVIAINLANSISVTCSAYQVSCDVDIVEFCNIGINHQVRVKVDGFIDVRKQRGSKQSVVSFWSKVTMMRKLNIAKSSVNIQETNMYVINKLSLTSKRNHAGRREVTSQNNDIVTTLWINVLDDGLNCYR